MGQVSVREARARLRELIERALAGEETVLLRRGKEVARLVPPQSQGKLLPELDGFRATIELRGEPASATVARLRDEQWP